MGARGSRKPDLPGTYSVEFGCGRSCLVELDLSEIHLQFTHGQMLRHAEAAHQAAHETPAPVKVFRFTDTTLVKATAVTP